MSSLRPTAVALLATTLALPGFAAVLSNDGSPVTAIVLAEDASVAERTAARELADYLGQAASAELEVRAERSEDASGPAIYVGPTGYAARAGIDVGGMGREDWLIRTIGSDLVLAGGRPRGTLYAVYRFLEEHVGVRWWTPFEETVPRHRDLSIGEIDTRGRPTFVYRDMLGIGGDRRFEARNRLNGHFSLIPADHGGREAYGPPNHVHNFYQYVPPDEYFEAHPEYFSEVDGERTGNRAQLCLTSAELLDLVATKMEGFVEQGRERAERTGEEPPGLYAFSQMDWRRPCTCDGCARVAEREGTHAGPLVEFINGLAKRMAKTHPGLMLDTLAYMYTFTPPEHLAFRENVVLRLSALFQRDFSKPVTHRSHAEYRKAIDGWRRATEHLRIWDYSVTFGRHANLPLPNLPVIAEDLRYYLAHGVEGVFYQHDYPVRGDMRDLKVWVLAKLMEDPSRDLERLVVEFTDGFYGPAGEILREYLALLERAAGRKPARIAYPATPKQYRYLDAKFLGRAQFLFDRAERAVRDDAVLLRRVRFARLSLDRATLWRWKKKLRRSLDPQAVAERYRATALERIERRYPEAERPRKREQLETELRAFAELVEIDTPIGQR